jgi:hypothetical protein
MTGEGAKGASLTLSPMAGRGPQGEFAGRAGGPPDGKRKTSTGPFQKASFYPCLDPAAPQDPVAVVKGYGLAWGHR